MSVIVIKYDGIDITDDVIIDDASFTSKTDGVVGEAHLRVRDLRYGPYDPNYFQVGKPLTLDIDGKRVWGGYLFTVTREYAFPVVDTTFPEVRERFWDLIGVDYNILFTKRLVYNKADPTRQLKIYNDDYVSDVKVITDLVTKYLDVGADEGFVMDGNHIDLRGVDVPYPNGRYVKKRNDCEEGYQIASPGMTWADAMRKVTDITACVFYIAPRAFIEDEDWPYDDPGPQELNGPWFMYHPNHTETGPYELNDANPGNVRNLTHTLDGTLLANDAHVWGAGMGSQGSVTHVESKDQTSVDTYGLFQWGDFSSTMWTSSCLGWRALSYVYGSWQTPQPRRRGHKDPREIWTCTLFKPDFQAGDVVAIRSYVHNVQSDGVPIREMKVTFPTPTDAQFDLVLSHEITPPWGTSMWWDQPIPRGGTRDPGDPPWREFIPYQYPMTIGSPAVNTDWTFKDSFQIGEQYYHFINHNDDEWRSPSIDFLDIGAFIGPENHAWYDCDCGGVGIGCYGPETSWRQGWYGFQLIGGVDRAASTYTAPDLFIPSQYLTRYGTGGKFAISFVTDPLELGKYGAADAWTGDGVPGTLLGEIDITGEPCEPSGICARDYFFRLYCNLGGRRIRDALYIPGSWIQPFYYSDEAYGYERLDGVHNWIVLTPLWRVPEVEVCDGEGVNCDSGLYFVTPGMQGQETSGTLRVQEMTAWVLGNAGTFPNDPEEISMLQSAAGARQVPSPDLDASGEYHTSYPYVPGTLEVFFNGMPLILNEDFWEMSPSTGAFTMRMKTDLTSQGGVDVVYQRDDLTSSTWDDWVSAYYPSPYPEGDTTINRVYRPLFQSQLGWGTVFDGVNCAAAAGAILADRHTFGTYRPTPPDIRTASGITSGGLSITDVKDALWSVGQYVQDPGVVNYDTFIRYLSEYRGAMLTGNSSALVPWDLNARSEYTGEPFVGWHSLYVNEVRADGYLYVYDPAFRVNSKYGITPGWYPPAAIKAYAAERTGSTNLVWAIYTQRQGRV